MTKAEAEPCAITKAANTCSSGDGKPVHIGTMCYACWLKKQEESRKLTEGR